MLLCCKLLLLRAYCAVHTPLPPLHWSLQLTNGALACLAQVMSGVTQDGKQSEVSPVLPCPDTTRASRALFSRALRPVWTCFQKQVHTCRIPPRSWRRSTNFQRLLEAPGLGRVGGEGMAPEFC